MNNPQYGNAVQQLLEKGWTWDDPALVSPSGNHIENPTAGEVLQILTDDGSSGRGPARAIGRLAKRTRQMRD